MSDKTEHSKSASTELAGTRFENHYANLPERFFSRIDANHNIHGGDRLRLLWHNETLSSELGLSRGWLESDTGLLTLSGRALGAEFQPIAMVYAGHQFGGFSPRLGDGRAMLLGQLPSKGGALLDVHLKGSGATAYSRRGDGKATLSSVLREVIVSEAMFTLGVPTTRALSAISTGETIRRQALSPGGVLARTATSHVRFGTFEYFANRGDDEALSILFSHVLERNYPNLLGRPRGSAFSGAQHFSDELGRAFLFEVATRHAKLVAHWMSLGFIHGVMNTDNMQIAGETIDFGPCAFIDTFERSKVFSSIDHHGRYAFSNQAPIAQWNLFRLLEALLPLFVPIWKTNKKLEGGALQTHAEKLAEELASHFQKEHENALHGFFDNKLGFSEGATDKEPRLLAGCFELLEEQKIDFTLFFRRLTQVAQQQRGDEHLLSLFEDESEGAHWLESWRGQLARPDVMIRANPIYIPRNHRVESALTAADSGDLSVFSKLQEVLSQPFEAREQFAEYELPPQPHEVVTETFCGT